MTISTSWQLARLAGCADPDQHDGLGFENAEPREGSAGANFLRRIEQDVDEYLNDKDDDRDSDDVVHEIADGAVPVYTHSLWAAFTDLSAYLEDPSDLTEDASDMTAAAASCLYMIAGRLAGALIDQGQEES